MFENHSMSSNASVNITNDTFPEHEEPLAKKVIKITVYCVLFLTSCIGNILIIWAIHRDNRLKSTTNILIANMAVSDLLVPLFSMPRNVVEMIFSHRTWLINGDFGLALCKLAFFLQDISWAVSVYSCIFIAIDRYYAVVHPFKGGFSRSRLKYIIPGIWSFAALVTAHYLYIFRLVRKGDATYCMQEWSLVGISPIVAFRIQMYTSFTLTLGFPVPIVCSLYLLIALKLRRNAAPGQTINTAARESRERRNKNVLKMSSVVVSLFFFTWLLFSVFMFLLVNGKLDSLSQASMNDLRFAVIFIAESSCAYNFFIYLVFTQAYRQNFKDIFSKCACFNPCFERFKTDSFSLENVAANKPGEVNVINVDS
jgi:hypothetical protein